MKKPVVAIVGRPNVGKSTFFNRMIGARKAIVDRRPGVTRDRNHGETIWNGVAFVLVDTGGFVPSGKDGMEAAIGHQVRRAIEEADLILLVVDVRVGVTDFEGEIVKIVRASGKKCLVVANKVDTEGDMADVALFYQLGLGEPLPVSALTGRMSGDLLDRVVESFEGFGLVEEKDRRIKIALVGRPNVGKSTFVNALVGRDEVIVDPKPGTTRDATDILFRKDGVAYILIDTAGLRRRTKIKDDVEFYSSLRVMESLKRCDVALVLLDVTSAPTNQDVRILARALELGKGAIIVMNKWDLMAKDARRADAIRGQLRQRLPFAVHLPVVFTSALGGRRVHTCIEMATRVYGNRRRRIPTGVLNRFLDTVRLRNPPSGTGGQDTKLFYGVQQGVSPPTFVFFSNAPTVISDSYKRFIERMIRERFDFEGTPIRVILRKK